MGIVAFVPEGMLRWTFPKYLVVGAAVGVALFARRTGRLPRWAWWIAGSAFVTLVIAALVGSVVYGTDVWAGLVGRWPRYLGPGLALPVAVGAAWLGAALLGPGAAPAVLRAFLVAVSAASSAVALVSLAETAGLRPFPSDLERPGSLFGNATDQGIVCAMMAVLLVGAVAHHRVRVDPVLRIAVPVGAVAGLVGLATSGSRGAYLAAIVGLIAVAVLLWRAGVLRGRVLLLGAAGVVGVLGAVILTAPGVSARLTGADPVAASTVGERWTLWQWGFQVWGTSPIVGAGSGSFIDRVPQFHDAGWYLDRPLNTVLESAHNWVLDAASDGGGLLVVVIALGLILTVVTAVRRMRSRSDDDVLLAGAVASILVAAVALLAHPTGPAVYLFVALLLGIVVAAQRPPLDGFGSPIRTIAARAAGIVAVLALALATSAEIPMGAAVAATPGVGEPEASLATATALRPWDPEMLALGAQTLTARAVAGDTGALDPAARWTAAAASAFPHTLAVLDARAALLETTQDWEAASAVRAQMVAVAPHDLPARQDLAIDQAMAGELDLAVETAAAILAEQPAMEQARTLIDQICAGRQSPVCVAGRP
ncbi:O-antigen ligase family protein [Microbacterium sp. NPDC016588]